MSPTALAVTGMMGACIYRLRADNILLSRYKLFLGLDPEEAHPAVAGHPPS